jgi:hypothetical protein
MFSVLFEVHPKPDQCDAYLANAKMLRPELAERRLDETQVGEGTTVILVDARRTAQLLETASAVESARYLGLDAAAAGLIGWDVFDAVLTPGDLILLLSWRTSEFAQAFENAVRLLEGARLRRVRVVRDYGMFDRREAPQCYPEVALRELSA